jgi:hypothetical protein
LKEINLTTDVQLRFADEIKRKTYLTLDDINTDFELGKVNKEVAYYTLCYLWDNISGFIDKETTKDLSDLIQFYKG